MRHNLVTQAQQHSKLCLSKHSPTLMNGQVQNIIRNATNSGDDGLLIEQLQRTGQFRGLSQVALDSVQKVVVGVIEPAPPGTPGGPHPENGGGCPTSAARVLRLSQGRRCFPALREM